MAFSFRHLPILGPKDTTANFEQLTGVIARLEEEITALGNANNNGSIGNEPWKLCSALGFKNSWTEYEAGARLPEYRKDRLGYVHLRGILKAGETGKAAFELPVGWRPKAGDLAFPINAAGSTGYVDVTAGGLVVPNSIGGEVKTYTYLDPVTFSIQ
jgi:hypothetical protein